jgi:hypothetical protein
MNNITESSRIKHLEMIQNIITRMNTNSFQIKGWSITIVSALLAVFASTKNSYFLIISIFPTLIFWFLDAYYLTQERKFRALYNDVAEVSGVPTKIKPFEIRIDSATLGKYSYWRVFRSQTIWPIYWGIIVFLVGMIVYLNFTK